MCGGWVGGLRRGGTLTREWGRLVQGREQGKWPPEPGAAVRRCFVGINFISEAGAGSQLVIPELGMTSFPFQAPLTEAFQLQQSDQNPVTGRAEGRQATPISQTNKEGSHNRESSLGQVESGDWLTWGTGKLGTLI